MLKKLLLTSFLLFSLFGVIYPTKKENAKLFNYCYSLEKIIIKNSIQTTKKLPGKFKSISKEIAKFGVSKTRGALINKMIDKYKSTKNSFIINLPPNEVYCLAGYWIENLKPGIFEVMFVGKSKKLINEFKDLKYLKDISDEVNVLINDINSEYKSIKEELINLF